MATKFDNYYEQYKSKFKDAAIYINGLPPLEIWVEIRQKIDPRAAVSTDNYWKMLGLSLYSYFTDSPDMLPYSKLSEDMQKEIRLGKEKYVHLSKLFLKSEEFLQKEAKERGLNSKSYFQTPSDMLEVWALEECQSDILLYIQNDWESYSKAERDKRSRIIRDYLLENTDTETFLSYRDNWKKYDDKLHRNEADFDQLLVWTQFFVEVFCKYKYQLGSTYEDWIKSLSLTKNYTKSITDKKFRVINQKFVVSPERGKDRTQRKRKN